jgi:hypothetical protein
MKYQKTDDVVLTTKVFYTFCDFASVAGFYGVGGQMYKPDWQTRSSAIYLLNPVLLKELQVNYVLLHKDDKLSQLALARLQDRRLFKEHVEINQIHPEYKFFEFVNSRQFSDSEIAAMHNEYEWVIGTKLGQKFTMLLQYGKPVVAQSKAELKTPLENFRKEVAKQNIPAAVWLCAQAMVK